jgi:hypothetical protein
MPPPEPDALARMNEALKVLRSRNALKDDHCPSCGTDNWNVDFLAIPSTPLLRSTLPAPPGTVYTLSLSPSSYIPAITFVCTNCGYMKMHNLNLLGLGSR